MSFRLSSKPHGLSFRRQQPICGLGPRPQTLIVPSGAPSLYYGVNPELWGRWGTTPHQNRHGLISSPSIHHVPSGHIATELIQAAPPLPSRAQRRSIQAPSRLHPGKPARSGFGTRRKKKSNDHKRGRTQRICAMLTSLWI